MPPKALITGIAGMLAHDLAASLESYMTVEGTDLRLPPDFKGPFSQGDLTDSSFALKTVLNARPHFIFHAAALTHVDGCEKNPETAARVNVETVKHMTDAANRVGAVLVFFSTDYVFDGTKAGEYVEEDAMNPLSVYGRNKCEAETYIRNHADQFTIFRVSWLYGLHGPSFPKTILEKAAERPEFEIVCDQIGRPTYTKDLALCLSGIFDKFDAYETRLNHETYHLTNGGTVSWADFAEYILAHSKGPKPPVRKIMTPPGHRPAKRPMNSVLSLEKSRGVLGVELRPWQAAVLDFIKKYEETRLK